MSSNGPLSSPTPSPASHAIDVGFSSIGNRHGESSSQAQSQSSDRRSSGSQRSRAEKATPPPEDSPREALPKSTGSSGHRSRSSGGFLLDSVFANGSPRAPEPRHGKRKMQDGPLRVDKRRHGPGRLSTESSLRGSPLSRQISMDVDGPADAPEEDEASRPPSMDAAKLVQMALELSENRKRHVSNKLRVPSSAEKRVASMVVPNIGVVRAVSGTRQRSGQFDEDMSRGLRDSQITVDGDGEDAQAVRLRVGELDDNIFYTFTPATLARAERARKYFELANEHRRLLDSLPPLKPDGSPSEGRSYNPIQSLRNRRVRIREKRPFPAPPEAWTDPSKVKDWIAEVETATRYSDYDTADESVTLPRFEGENEPPRPESRQLPAGPRHKRTETVGSVITRPENSWTIEPTELLADAYWTEKADNKGYIETRRGEPIFPSRQRQSVSTPKISIELHRGRNEGIEHVDSADDLQEYARPSRRRRLMLPLATGMERRRPGRLMRRTSVSSEESSSERRGSGPLLAGSVENIGPLERHMQDLIAKDEKGELSPETSPPDHWNSRFKQTSTSTQRDSIEIPRPSLSSSRPDGRASLEVPRDLHRRARSADGRVGSIDHAAYYGEDDDTGSEPGSPVFRRNLPSIGMDLSPPVGVHESFGDDKPRIPALPTFHSRNRERNKIGQTDFADGIGTNLSPIQSASSYRPFEAPAPDTLKRPGTNESWTNLRRLDTGSTMASTKASGSTVGRFLRNRRGRIFKNREKNEEGDVSAGLTDASEAEDNASLYGPVKRRTMDEDSDGSPLLSNDAGRAKPKFHLNNLPSFTSSARDKRIQIESPRSVKDDPFKNHSKRPRRFDQLAPLTLITSQAMASDPELVRNSDDPNMASRKGYGQLDPEFREVPWPPRLRPGLFPGISQAKRHWSIYDTLQSTEDNKITTRDIARARALLLSSGIKAREIQRRADHPRTAPSALVSKAAIAVRQPLEIVPIKDEPIVAARMLSGHLSMALRDFENALSNFENGTVRTIGSQLEALRQRVADHLSILAHDTSDEADAFTMELNTKTPQQTKRVDDAVDEMLRRRRRQFRLVRVTGFKLLEWLVLGILWWIWFLVFVFNTGRKIIVALFRVLHWLFTF